MIYLEAIQQIGHSLWNLEPLNIPISMGCYVILLDFFAKIDFLVSFCSSWPVDYENFGCHFSKVSKGVKGIIFQLQKMAAKCNAYHSAF